MAEQDSRNYRANKSIVPTEAELENLLDAESDDEFGQTESQVASVDTRAVLKNWTAQDFSSIYTRFRPHLERHARRFLRNQSQVDEVVQDAFLYLMVTLPELDSELGVLRFLKWKVRLLSLDVIRINSKAQLSDIDAHAEFESDEPEVGIDLERAEDAAIVQMALAKLDPRHREVLIASIYQEKSTLEIAEQVGLTENATRQLMHRARGALKKALVGEADTSGLSVSQILSVAARKAAQDAKKVGVQAMSTLVIAVLGLAAFLNFGPSAQVSEIAVPAPSATASENGPVASEQPTAPAESTTQDGPLDARPGESLADSSVLTPESGTESSNAVETLEVVEETTAAIPAAVPVANAPIVATAALDPLVDLSPFDPWLLDDVLQNGISTPMLFQPETSEFGDSQLLTAVSDSGIWFDATFAPNSRTPLSEIRLGFLIDGEQYSANPSVVELLVQSKASGVEQYIVTAKIGEVVDAAGVFWPQSRLKGSLVNILVVSDSATGEVLAVDLDWGN
jgi:RNA polymerase sigma factor (sigma-70 family)